jgi:hypothetical protein
MSEPSWALTSSGMADGSHPAPETDNGNEEAEAAAEEAAEAAALHGGVLTQRDLSSSSDEADQSSNESKDEDDRLMGVCEKEFPPSSGDNKKKLLAMCYGLDKATAGHSLGMTDVYPFKDTVRRVNFIPNRDQLRDEIYRQAAIPATCGGVTRKPKAGN